MFYSTFGLNQQQHKTLRRREGCKSTHARKDGGVSMTSSWLGKMGRGKQNRDEISDENTCVTSEAA